MAGYIIRRLLWLPVTLLAVSFLTFAIRAAARSANTPRVASGTSDAIANMARSDASQSVWPVSTPVGSASPKRTVTRSFDSYTPTGCVRFEDAVGGVVFSN